MSEAKLKELWGFDDADVAANRLGKLTEKQRKFLMGEHKSQRAVFIGVGAVVAFIFCCLPIVFGARTLLPLLISGDLGNAPDLLPLLATGGMGFGFVAAIAVPVAIVFGIYLLRANKKEDISVKRAEGTVKYSSGTKRVRTPTSSTSKWQDVRVLHLNLGDKKFEVKEQMQEIVKEDDAWTIYYTSYPFKFLSAEPVSKEK